MRLALPAAVMVTAMALSATTAATATAAPQGGSFCGTAKSIATYLHSTLQLDSSGAVASTPANLKLAYTTVVGREGALLGSAPASLKPSLTGAFSFVNLVKSDFAKAGWQVKNLAPYLPALVAKAKAETRPLQVVRTYLRGTCHLPI